jgi:hypothetical protein
MGWRPLKRGSFRLCGRSPATIGGATLLLAALAMVAAFRPPRLARGSEGRAACDETPVVSASLIT